MEHKGSVVGIKYLSDWQINNLMIGVTLAAEIDSKNPELRGFISIFAYRYNEFGDFVPMDKFLKNVDREDMFFVLRKFEITREHMENGWDTSEGDLINAVYMEDIKGVKNVEIETLKYMGDVSVLAAEWKCDIPL